LRDYAAAIGHFETSRERAAVAAELSQRAVRRDRANSSRALAGADAALDRLSGVEDRIWLAEGARQQLQRARALAAEAHSFAQAGAYAEAGERAREAHRAAEGVSAALLASTSRFTADENIGVWREWVDETVEWSRRTGRVAVVVDKDSHLLSVYQGGRLIREFDAELGWNNVGDKFQEGDGATPEGRYKVTRLKGRGQSRFYKALLLDYPNRDNLARLERLKADGTLPRGTRPGSLIEIHGEGGRGKDWTDGCVAVTNAEMDWLFARVAVGTPVTIVGSLSGQGAFSDVARRMER
jgi:L,D-peptidoglycan transpeptidase YkuD (ErfK/YbiS/YcfS/YnhG family)